MKHTSQRIEEYYFARCIATQTRLSLNDKYDVGDEKIMVAGEWHGMGGEKYPAWTETIFSTATHFTSPEEAREYVRFLSKTGSDFVINEDTIEIVWRQVIIETTTYEEIIFDE